MGLIDNQKLQKGVATLLGVADESDQATKIARQWAEDNEYSDSEEDTLRHVLLGGFMQSVQGEGFGRMGKEIAGKLINKRESTDKESLIDVANNNFGRQLRKELINKDKDSSVEGFVEAAKNFVHNLRAEKEVRDVDGLRPKMSTAGQEKQIDMAKGGVVLMNKQMELFASGGLKDEGGSVDEVSGNDVPVGSLKEEVRDDIPAKLSEGEFVLPADVVRFYGLAHIMKMRDVAKAGLAKMDAMGQMGNSDEATMEDDMPFSMEDLEVVDEEGNSLEYADGGYVRKFEVGGYNPSTGTTTQTGTGTYQAATQPTIGMNQPNTPYTPFTPTVQTSTVPTGFQPKFLTTPTATTTPLPTFDQVQGGTGAPVQVTKKYKDANGNIIEIPLDAAGNPIYAPPEGYVPDTGVTSPVIPLPDTGAPSIPTVQQESSDNDKEYVRDTSPAPVNWNQLDYKGVVEEATKATSGFAKAMQGIIGGGLSAIVPGAGSALIERNRTTIGNALINAYLSPEVQKNPEQKAALESLWAKNQSILSQFTGKTTSLLDSIPEGQKYKAPVAKPIPSAVEQAAAKLGAGLTGEAARYHDDQIKRGYTGSSVDRIAVGNIATLDANGKSIKGNPGVLTDSDGRVVKDPSGSGKTVFVDSAGVQYTEGLFGMGRKTLDGNVYEGPADARKRKTDEEKLTQAEILKANEAGTRKTEADQDLATVVASTAERERVAKETKARMDAAAAEAQKTTISGGSGTQKQVIASKDKDYSDNTSNWGNASAATVSAAKSGTGAFSSGAASKTQSKSINKSKATKGYKGGRAKGGLMTKKKGI
jgi:hypothetical protein